MEYTLYQLLWFFLVYSFLGWLMETAAAAAKKRQAAQPRLSERPLLPGLRRGRRAVRRLPAGAAGSDPFFLFLGGMILATALELVTGALLERIFRQKWWDYSDERWNFQRPHLSEILPGLGRSGRSIYLSLGNPLLVPLTDLDSPLGGQSSLGSRC